MASDSNTAHRERGLRWRGLMAPSAFRQRVMTALCLGVLAFAIIFTQLTNISIPLAGAIAYATTIIIPIALCALLLGTAAGVVFGLAVGAVSYAHAIMMPLDFNELALVTPQSTIALLSFVGLVSALALDWARRPWTRSVARLSTRRRIRRRLARLALAAFAIALAYTAGSFASVITIAPNSEVRMLPGVSVAVAFSESVTSPAHLRIALALQVGANTVLLTLVLWVTFLLARRLVRRLSELRIRDAFRMTIFLVATIAFIASSTVSFVSVTESQLAKAEESVRSEVNYLCLQLRDVGNRARAFTEMAEATGISEQYRNTDDYKLLSDRVGKVLDGYTLTETGTVAILREGKIIATDDVRLLRGADVGELIGQDIANAVKVSVERNEVRRILYDGVLSSENVQPGAIEEPQIGYLLAAQEGEFTVMIIEPSGMIFRARTGVMIREAAVSGVLLLVVFALITRLLNWTVASRIEGMNRDLARITGGDLEVRVDEREGTREFASLASGINQTVEALRGSIAEAESRIDAELATAAAIQESALPCVFPPFPSIMKFDLYASMNPARQVGGDFYDFFTIGDFDAEAGKVGFVVADVSGKGVPAALFMMRAKTLIRDYLESGMELGEAVENANRMLVDGNDEGMFVTAWIGVLDYATGHIDYVNAGHNPPLLNRSGGEPQWLTERSGPILGLFDVPYTPHSVDCGIGDTLLLYTDGVTEAFSEDDELFGEERLMEVARASSGLSPHDFVESVQASVTEFTAGAEQSDDITILAMQVGVAPETAAVLEVPARIEELYRINDFVHAELDGRLCPHRTQMQLDIAIEELFSNIVFYAYPEATEDKPGMVRVECAYSDDPPACTLRLIDEGTTFNPLANAPEVTPPASIDDTPIGGLGIFMTKKLVDELGYQHSEGRNIVTIVKRW